MPSFQFRQCLTPSIQPGVKLASRKRSCTTREGDACPSGAVVADEDLIRASNSRFVLERSGNLPLCDFLDSVICISALPSSNHKGLSPAPSSPSTVSSLGPGYKTLLHSLRRMPKPSYCTE